jgi:hypothetical protein
VNVLTFSYLVVQAKTLENWLEIAVTVLFWTVIMTLHGDPLQQYLTSQYSIRGNTLSYEDQRNLTQLSLNEIQYARETEFGLHLAAGSLEIRVPKALVSYEAFKKQISFRDLQLRSKIYKNPGWLIAGRNLALGAFFLFIFGENFSLQLLILFAALAVFYVAFAWLYE